MELIVQILFNISDLIWLPYKTSFKYRSSSMLMEVLNYKKPIIARRIEKTHKRLEQISEVEELYRAQGEIRVLRAMLRLREDING